MARTLSILKPNVKTLILNNEAKYILITTDSKEFGYMAVSYLAAVITMYM